MSGTSNPTDSHVVTGPRQQTASAGNLLLTPTGGTRGRLADILGSATVSSASTLLAQSYAVARAGNVRTNPVMTTPPVITLAAMWGANTPYVIGQKTVNIIGSGAAAIGRWYTCAVAGTTSAANPPTGTGNGIVDGTVTWNFQEAHPTEIYANSSVNSYMWANGTGRAVNTGSYYGGIISSDVNTYCMYLASATVNGAMAYAPGRWRFMTDAIAPVVRMFNIGSNTPYRIIVDRRYASLTPVVLTIGAWDYLLLNFTTAGGRAVRDITIECQSGSMFGGVDVAVTESVWRPITPKVATLVMCGDSHAAQAGASIFWNGFGCLLADYLGVDNFITVGIGGTGYLVSATSGPAISRVSDILTKTAAFPNSIVIDDNGNNDVGGFTSTQIYDACLAFMRAIRSGGFTGPIIEFGIFGMTNNGLNNPAGIAAENAKKAAVAAMKDPLIYFIPFIQAPGGPVFTGTGNDGAPNGTGNSDIYANATSLPHLNDAGHAYLANYLLSVLPTLLASTG